MKSLLIVLMACGLAHAGTHIMQGDVIPSTSVSLGVTGVGFGSSVGGLTADATNFAWIYDKHSLCLGCNNPYIVVSTGTLLTMVGSAVTIDLENSANDATGFFVRNNTAGTYGETGVQMLGTGGSGFISGSVAGDTVISNKTGKIFIQPQWPTGGAVAYFDSSGLNFPGLYASQFLQTDSNNYVSSYDLLNTTQTWTGVNTFSSMTITTGGLAGRAICWKTNSTLGYCSSVVGVGGACTCN